MSLTVTLSPAQEQQLQSAARSRGICAEELAYQLVSAATTVSTRDETGRSHHEEMSEERRDWDPITRR